MNLLRFIVSSTTALVWAVNYSGEMTVFLPVGTQSWIYSEIDTRRVTFCCLSPWESHTQQLQGVVAVLPRHCSCVLPEMTVSLGSFMKHSPTSLPRLWNKILQKNDFYPSGQDVLSHSRLVYLILFRLTGRFMCISHEKCFDYPGSGDRQLYFL